MKILISSDGMHAHYFQRMAWARAFAECGMEVYFWDSKNIPAFDAFDSFEPDIFMGQSYNLDRALLKCIYERPHLKVGLRAGDWGDFTQDNRFNVLYATEHELDQQAVDQTHSKYKTIGIDAKSLIMCADVQEYLKSDYDEALSCDIGFVGGYWPYKGIVIDNYLTPLCYPVGNYNIKIFGNQPWTGVNQYCGYIQDNKVKDLFRSAKICPNLSEPHAHEYGFDINERCFKILCAGGFCISDNITSIRNIFDDNGVVFAESPDDFASKIDYYLKNEDERVAISQKGREFVLNNHTNFHRISDILQHFGYQKEATDIVSGWQNAKEYINE